MPRTNDYDDYDDKPSRSSVPFPTGVKAAGIIWICFGILGLIGQVLSFAMNVGGAVAAQGQGGPPQGNVCGLGCGVLFAIVFLVVGIQTVKGTAKGTLANGIGSIIFGLIYAGLAVLVVVVLTQVANANGSEEIAILMGGIMGLLSLALFSAGILAIAGRDGYTAWRSANGLGPKRRRRRAEEDDYDDRRRRPSREDDDDDRPRRPRRDDD